MTYPAYLSLIRDTEGEEDNSLELKFQDSGSAIARQRLAKAAGD